MASVEEVRRQANRDDVCQDARLRIRDQHIHLTGHFDLGNGRCSDEYYNPHPIIDNPTNITAFAQCLIDLNVDACQADVIAGPQTGGVLLAHSMASLITSSYRSIGEHVSITPLYPATDQYELRPHYRALVKGKRVWLVDDVLRTGNTLNLCAIAIEEAGGRVVATSVILHNMGGVRIADPILKGVRHDYIQSFRARNSWSRESCQMCANGQSFTQF